MERIVFCLIIALLSVGCMANAQIQGNNSNVSSNFNGRNVSSDQNFNGNSYNSYVGNMEKPPSMERPLSRKMASQTKLYKVCGNPNVQCKSEDVFEESDLSFEVIGELEWFGRYKSKPFYAIMLKSRKVIVESFPADEIQQDCGGQFTEDERLEAQKLFPENKVFTTAFGCYYGTHEYTNIDYNFNFMAVYGGERISQANALLKKARDSGKFSDANVRKMQTILCRGCH